VPPSEATKYGYGAMIMKVATITLPALNFHYHYADTELVTSHKAEAVYVSKCVI
jgi:hypothetical protein